MKLIPLRQVQFPVLIETYWNVNFDAFLLVSAMDAPVLIETYWNVNASDVSAWAKSSTY